MHILDKIGISIPDILDSQSFSELSLIRFQVFPENPGIYIFIGITIFAHADLKPIKPNLFDMVARGILNIAA
jgi:hypothetical protein